MPATIQSRFAGQALDPGYLTTIEGTRATGFHDGPTADPAVIALDDATRETVTAAELGTVAVPFVLPGAAAPVTVPACAAGAPLCGGPADPAVRGPASAIDVPSLVVLGQQDVLICGQLGTDCSSAAAVRRRNNPSGAPTAWASGSCRGRSQPYAAPQRYHWYATVQDWVHGLDAADGGCPGPVAGVV